MAPPTYTEEQLETYLRRIGYPPNPTQNTLIEAARQNINKDALAALSEIQKRHLASIPWGNSGLHYSQHHTISLNPDTLFEKMVERRLDGYCMENTGLFFIVLRSLSYFIYATGGRVSPAASTGKDPGFFSPLGHMVLIVIIDGAKYMVDVGFGNNCATAPLPLQDGATATSIAPSKMRLIRDTIPEYTDKSQKLWIYQTKYTAESEWLPMICFSDVEFLPQDFEVMNFAVSQKRTSWFTKIFVCMRMLLDEDGQEVIGQLIMAEKELKRRVHGQTEILQVFNSEEDRVEALAKNFDMHLRNSEAQGIRGLTSEIK